MSVRQILGLSGYARVGKDESAKALIAKDWTRVSFADPLREAALAIDPWIKRDWREDVVELSYIVQNYGWDEAKKNEEVRWLLQRLGTEAGRNIHGENCWVEIARRKIEQVPGNVVLTDCRFPNEAKMIRSLGGRLVRIQRPGVGPVNGHVSEQFDFDYDYLIENNGTVEQLHEKILSLINGGA